MRQSSIVIALIGALVAGCADAATAPTRSPVATGASYDISNRPGDEPGCTFDQGVTTCVTIATHAEMSTHQTFSGCVAGPPPFHFGRRVTTWEDTWLVTVTTTTLQHGRAGLEYESSSTETRDLVSSRQISSICE